MDWSVLVGPLTQVGGTILGGLIGGPAGAMLGPAIGATLGQALGVPATPTDIGGALAQPGAAATVQQIEADHAATFRTAEKAYLDDIADARSKQLEYAKMGSTIAYAPIVISTIIVIGFLGLVFALLFRAVPDSQLAMVLFGALTAAFGQVVNYWLGSSKGSADKNATVDELLRGAVTTVKGGK